MTGGGGATAPGAGGSDAVAVAEGVPVGESVGGSGLLVSDPHARPQDDVDGGGVDVCEGEIDALGPSFKPAQRPSDAATNVCVSSRHAKPDGTGSSANCRP